MIRSLKTSLQTLWKSWVDADISKSSTPFSAPDRLWLQLSHDSRGDLFASGDDGPTWGDRRSGADDIEYVRLDVAMRMLADHRAVAPISTQKEAA